VAILFGAMWFTRRRDFSIIRPQSDRYTSYLDNPDSARSSDELLRHDSLNEDEKEPEYAATASFSKHRKILGFTVVTPNSSQFKNNIHSRILQRFPFLIEMFYWIINYSFYRLTSVLSQRVFAESGIWQVAERHGVWVLQAEEFGWLSLLFPVREKDVQSWFMNGHQDALTVLNRVYALIHIPGTVG